MAPGAAVLLAADFLEHQNLVGAGLLKHGGDHLGASDQGRADGGVGAFAEHQHLVELDGGTGLAGQLLDLDDVVGGDPVLLPTGLDNCVHGSNPLAAHLSGARARRGEGLNIRLPERAALYP